ncbi:MAG: hypothetical protein GXO83_09640 [Chlorobi bacterium]|nr:hypothetical protein [Chlorobiota bacterium]
MKRFLLPLVIFWLAGGTVLGQFYDNGQDPASLRWKKIDTKHYRLIFPDAFMPEAQRLANLLDYSYDFVNYSLQSVPKKIPVVIHNQSTISNGMVVWAPKRIEFYTVPDPNSYPQDELEQLTLHELRHVAQMEKINRRFTGMLGYVTGDLAVGGLSAMIPLWFMEGDAVSSETVLSHAGRGRLPAFEMGLRAISLEQGEMYRYDKSLLGSYRDYVPDWYEFGYQVTAWSRENYGISLWNHALDKIAGYPFTINPVNISFWKDARTTKKRLYDSAFFSLHRKWLAEDAGIKPTPFTRINTSKRRAFASYRYPRYINDSLLVVEKSGIDDINRFVLMDRTGKETYLFTPGYYQPVRLSAGGNKLVWAETIYDERWNNRNFSVIKMLDIKTGKEWIMTRRSRYFAPDISKDGKQVAAVRIETDNTCFIDILDAQYGKVIKSFTLPGNVSFFKPVWKDPTHLLVIVLTDAGKDIRELNINNGKWEIIYTGGFSDIQSVWPAGEYVLFHSTLSGIDNIYAINRISGKLFRVTSSRFGASDVCVSPNGNKIAYSDYASQGYNIAETGFDPSKWQPLEKVKMPAGSYRPMLKEEKGLVNTADIPDSTYEVEKYHEATHLFRFHSWLPLYFDYENLAFEEIPVSPGIMLFTQNLLSTATGSVGYSYKDRQHHLITRFTYKGWYPVFDLSYSLGGDPLISRDSTGIPLPPNLPPRNEFRLKTYIPLNLTNNCFSRGLFPSVDMQYTNSFIWNQDIQDYDHGRILMSYRLYYYSLLKMGDRDIRPRLGFSVDARFSHAPWNTRNYGTKSMILGTVYLPGFLPHNTLRLRAGMEKQVPAKFYFLNQLPYPKGYENWLSEKFTVLQTAYDFPIFYPDFAISSLIYIPRFRGQFFWETAKGEGNYDYYNHQSIREKKIFQGFGGELTMDFYALRIGFPISLGIWGAYLPEQGTFKSGISFNIDVYGLSIARRKQKPIQPGMAVLPGLSY